MVFVLLLRISSKSNFYVKSKYSCDSLTFLNQFPFFHIISSNRNPIFHPKRNAMKTKTAAVLLLLLSYFTSFSQSSAPSPAIMADKMNVLYLGLDNPVTIGTAGTWDKVEVSINNGSITGTGAHRIIRPANVGSCEVIVSVDKKIWTFNYRVKRMPDPVVMFDGQEGSMPLETFRKIKSLKLDYSHCDFDVEELLQIKEAIISFVLPDCSFQVQLHSKDLSPLANIYDMLVPGTIVTIRNVTCTDQKKQFNIEDSQSIVLY